MNLFNIIKKLYKKIHQEEQEIIKHTFRQIETKDTVYHLMYPIECEIRNIENYCIAKNEHLNIVTFAAYELQALQSFKYLFSQMYEYYMYTNNQNVNIDEHHKNLRDKYIGVVKSINAQEKREYT